MGFVSHAATIKGCIIDASSNEGESFATVRIYQPDNSTPLVTLLCNENGEFITDTIPEGDLIIEISAFGKKTVIRDIKVTNNETINLGTIELTEDVKNLDEIEITAQNPLVEMTTDEVVYNVSLDKDANTYSLLEMLRKVPMVTVDGADNIMINGSSNFQVYIDGKPNLLFSGNPSQILTAMPASSVQKIEVITNPGAKYDAEGIGGVLNLIMNRNMGTNGEETKGYNVSVNLRAGNRVVGGNIYATGQIKKLSASLNLIENYSMLGTTEISTIRREEALITESFASSKPKLPFTMGNLNLNYELDSFSSIGLSFSLNKFSNDYKSFINTVINSNQINLFKYSEASQNNGGRHGINGSINYSRDIGKERKHQINFTYQIGNESQNSFSNNIFSVELPPELNMDNRKSDSKLKTIENIFLADFSTKFKNNQLSIGLKATLRKASADNQYYISEILSSKESLYYKNKNNIGAAFAEYSFSQSLLNLKAGLRYEHTWQSMYELNSEDQNYSNNYGNFIPSGTLSFNLRYNSNIGINYNMRISRPGISYLNPYINQSDPTLITYGNPDLTVEKTHNVSLVYNFFTYKLYLNAVLSNAYTNNGIEEYSFLKDGILNTTYGNIVSQNQVSLNTFINWRISDNTSLMFNGSGNYLNIESKQLQTSNKGFQGNFMFGVQQLLPWDINGNAYLIVYSKSRNLQGWDSGFNMINLNFSKSLLKEKLNINIGFNSGLSKNGKILLEKHIKTNLFTNKSSTKISMLSFNIGITFKFGNSGNIKEVKNNKIDNDFIDTRSPIESISNSGGESI